MKRLILSTVALASISLPAQAQEVTREETAMLRTEDIAEVLRGEEEAPEVFAPSFLKAVPATQLAALSARLIEQNGELVSTTDQTYRGNGAASFSLVFEHAQARASLQLDTSEPWKVTGFHIHEVTPLDDSPQKIMDDFAHLPGEAGFGVYILTPETESGVLLQNAEEQFAIGSTFKLWVLSALVQQIKAGQRHWDDVVPLGTPSLPSGQMQDWPEGAPVTLQTLATMMISISDNTATDTLIHLLGREAIAAEVIASGHAQPERTLPFLTTAEMFALKSGDPQRLATYAAADSAEKARLLEEWAPELTAASADVDKLIGSPPTAIDSVEWFASAQDIARIFQRLRNAGDPTVLDILSVTPSLSDEGRAKWDYVGYKGGSETGVLNLSWLFRTEPGAWYVVTASWNNRQEAVDQTKLELLALRLIGLIDE